MERLKQTLAGRSGRSPSVSHASPHRLLSLRRVEDSHRQRKLSFHYSHRDYFAL